MGAVIVATRIGAAHDGAAEMVVTLQHDNGGTSEVVLDEMAASALLQSCAASHPQELSGIGWEKVRDALAVSWNRYDGQSGR